MNPSNPSSSSPSPTTATTGTRYLRNLAEEARRLREALAPAERAGLCQVVVRQNTTSRRFRRLPGHANPQPGGGLPLRRACRQLPVLFEGAVGEPAPRTASLAAFLGHQTGLQLAFLNGCSTQGQAQGLLDGGVAVVVATSQAIEVENVDLVDTRGAQRLEEVRRLPQPWVDESAVASYRMLPQLRQASWRSVCCISPFGRRVCLRFKRISRSTATSL